MWNEQLVFSLDGGGTVTVTNANIWQGGLAIEQSVSSDGFFEIGSTHVGQMTVTLVDTFEDIDFQNATVAVSMAKDSNTLQQIGVYTVVRSERDNGILGITAYDNMTLLSEPYTTALSYPSTYGAMVHEIVGTTIQFDGSTTAVQTAPEFEPGTTKREVLGYIAQACGYNVKCDENGQYRFVRYNMSGFNTSGSYHEISSLFDFHHSYYPVVITGAKVIVRTTVPTTDPDTGETTVEEVVSEYTSGTDDYQIVIEGNPLITTANGQLVANTIFATFGGVEFYTGSVSHLSDLSIKASDIMKVTDRTGTTYPMLVSSTQISTGSPQLSQSFADEPASKLSVQPSIIDRVQTSVRQALLDAKNAQNKGNYAARIAGNTNQYFWHTSTGTDTGAHITEIPQEDFLDDPTNGGGNTLIRSNGVAVRDGLTELSTFSANGCYIGNETTSRLLLNNVGITGMTDTGVETFKVVTGDYSGTQTITETTGIIENTASDKTTMHAFYNAKHSPSSATDVVFNLSIVVEYGGQTKSCDTQVDYRYDPNNIYIQSFGADKVMMFQSGNVTVHIEGDYQTNRVGISFDITVNNLQAKIQNAQVSVTMPIPDPVLPSYTFGTRVERPDQYGSYSFIAGSRNKATDDYSVALGVDNVASGLASLAVNDDNKATGLNSFASGNGSIASGARASTFGGDTLASSNDQMVIGRRNVEDANDTYAFIIGNGDYAEETRSNAFTVDWSGNVGYFGNAIPDQTNTRYLGNSTHRWQNLYSHYVNASATITAGAVTTYTPTWASGHTAADYHCIVSAGVCSFSYRGPTIAHANSTTICTLPVGARPKSVVYCPCVKMSGGAVGCIRIMTTGVCEVIQITDTSSTGRLYFNCSFPVV